MSKYGNNNIGKMFFGSNSIGKAYYGSDLVFQKGAQPPIPLPYDARVEYLSSSADGAYIDTGIECSGDLSIETRIWWNADTNAALAGGILSLGGGSYFRHHLSPSEKTIYWYQSSNSVKASIESRDDVSSQTWHNFSLNASTGEWTFDSESGTVTPLSGTLSTGRNYGIFARVDGSGNLQAKASRIASFKLSKNGVVLRDCYAVRVGSVGYMYDEITGQLFGNSGSSSLGVGPDVSI